MRGHAVEVLQKTDDEELLYYLLQLVQVGICRRDVPMCELLWVSLEEEGVQWGCGGLSAAEQGASRRFEAAGNLMPCVPPRNPHTHTHPFCLPGAAVRGR